MDLRHARRQKSEKAFIEALARLKSGHARHPRHVGLTVRITKQAVALEAGVSSATLYRCPKILAAISECNRIGEKQSLSAAEQRRRAFLVQIDELQRQVAALSAENFRLTRLLMKSDPTLGLKNPTELGAYRERKSTSDS